MPEVTPQRAAHLERARELRKLLHAHCAETGIELVRSGRSWLMVAENADVDAVENAVILRRMMQEELEAAEKVAVRG